MKNANKKATLMRANLADLMGLFSVLEKGKTLKSYLPRTSKGI